MRPEYKGNLTQAAIHQLYEKQETRHKKRRNSRGKERWITQLKMHQERNLFQLWSKACISKKSMACNVKCRKKGNFGSRSVCKSKRGGNVNELQTQPIDAPSNEDSVSILLQLCII
ncbi:unnamed protein product [Porites evermanni]|uniref:Uncharacterized protein n=1 Tax=Porites evermanni TaxID=104178 RepID=A0ABN8S5G2_9CNID|nr:unnamed protein product [Porites evermanni]